MRRDGSDSRLVATVRWGLLDDHKMSVIRQELLERHGERPVYLELSRVQYVSSSALRVLIDLHVRINQAGGRLVLCNLVRPVLEVFELLHLDRFFQLVEMDLDTEGEEPGPGGAGVSIPRRPREPSDEGSAFLLFHDQVEDE